MKKRVCTLGGSVLFLLLASCSDNTRTVDCQENFTAECEQELTNTHITSPILRASFAGAGCAQNNLQACLALRGVTGQSQTQLEGNKILKLNPTDESSLFPDNFDSVVDISRNFCDIKSIDHDKCIAFIDSLKGFISGLTRNIESLTQSDNNHNNQLSSNRELSCYEGNLLDCEPSLKQQHSELSSQKVQIMGEVRTLRNGKTSTEVKSKATVCSSTNGDRPVCREYENFIPQETNNIDQITEKTFKIVNPFSQQQLSPYKSSVPNKRDLTNATCNEDQQCSTIIDNSLLQDKQQEKRQSKNSSEYSDDQNDNSTSAATVEKKSSQLFDSMKFTEKMSQTSIDDQVKSIDDLIESRASKIFESNWLDDMKGMPIIALVNPDNKSASNLSLSSSSELIKENFLNTPKVIRDSDLDSNPVPESISVAKLALPGNFANELQPSPKVVTTNYSLPSRLSKGLNREEMLVGHELGETLMQNQLNTNLQTFFDSISKGQEKGLLEAQWKDQQKRLKEQEIVKKKAQALSSARNVASYPPAVQTLKTSCDNNNIASCYELANAFNRGYAGTENRNKAQEIYNDLCRLQREDTERQYYCARLNIEGEIVEPNLGRAVELFNQSCQKSFRKSCESLEMLKQIGVNAII
ncbi:MAG: hypothetical protein GKC53_03030 [Neisseriaceae bacterium]|nr:MAG: hypothetical protein GKC53_03030 [Neisseriaceae bacterium]